MGLRASQSASEREKNGTLLDDDEMMIWPSKRTVLIRADKGVRAQPYAEGVSELLDLEKWAGATGVEVELRVLGGSHFGILNPDSGLAEVVNDVLA
jgi:fatty acid synthase, animal type